jgi:hypothetical protein
LLRYDAAYNSAAGAWILLNAAGASAATTSAAGIVELATVAETLAGSSSALAVTPAGLSPLYSNVLNNAIEIADLKGSRLNMAGGIADAYDSEDDVDTVASTNESYDATNDLYSPATGGGTISGATGTNIGDLTISGGLAAAYDGATNTAFNSCAQGAAIVSPTDEYIGKNYSSSPKKISGGTIYGSNNGGLCSGFNGSVTVELRGKNGSAPSTPGDGTLLGSLTFTDTSNESAGRAVSSSDTATEWDYVWHRIQAAQGNASRTSVAEAVFIETTIVNNMTLVSDAFTATAVPTVARIATFIDPQEAITINTDFTAEVSRDGGTTWTAVTLALVSNPVGTVEQYEGTVSISAQPSGSSMKYRLKTLNNKDIDVTGTVFQWS